MKIVFFNKLCYFEPTFYIFPSSTTFPSTDPGSPVSVLILVHIFLQPRQVQHERDTVDPILYPNR